MKSRGLSLITAIAIGLSSSFGIGLGTAKADSPSVTVNTKQNIRPNVSNSADDHVASGGLYGISDENTPTASLLSPLKPTTFTQAPPDGMQVGKGAGQFNNVAPLVHQIGAKQIVRLADIYDQWPYNFSNEQDWLAKVKKMVQSAQNSDYANDIYGYELWNEPNGNWQGAHGSNPNGTWGDFYKIWDDTYHIVKEHAPDAKIVGPSLSYYNDNWLKAFLAHAKAAGTLPDIISWHQWSAAGFKNSVAALDSLEDSLGITRRKISINEYAAPQELAVPGQMIHYIQNFENAPELDSADLAFWFNYGRMDNLLTDQQKPNGGYWLYKWYADMSGQLDETSTYQSNGDFSSLANTTTDKSKTSVIFGGTNGAITVKITGLAANVYDRSAHVTLEETPWYGVDTPVSEPNIAANGVFSIENDSISVSINNLKKSSAYRLVVTPSSNAATNTLQYTPKSPSDPIRVEAENSTLSGKAVVNTASYASANQFVGTIDTSESGVTFTVNAPTAGQYTVEVGYANGPLNKQSTTATDKVTLNGELLSDIVFPPTIGWTNTVVPSNNTGTRQIVQYGTVTLKQGENTLTLSKDTNYAELDYAQFTLLKH
ncbi:hypothetical protein NIE88_02510 [Sporolactobacillus shoreicorticis]|uniref:CBM35 domain-containing protein n=1 Tax=Sporolactobacillus shoreicorticis TaxID=1923877 RepID=A0ABW5S0C0_9BACL|nr:CBM35 domain-containing protein [Sporolactobacillus shoreicorticis]MCO7124652.1 hypothetical protein [Sporolactobacillus shoreicorticis]